MKLTSFVFLILFIASVLVPSCYALNGFWRDICSDGKCYGGVMSLCVVDDNEIYGRYSDIGFIRGTVSEGKIEGVWFEAGYSQRNHGGFEWRMTNNDGDAFTGSWWFSDRKCDRFGWASEKIDDSRPSFAQCGVLLNNQGGGNIFYKGYWQGDSDNNQLWLCEDQRAYFHGSGTLTGRNINVAGKAFLNGEVLTASYWTNEGTQGIMLMNLLSPVDLVVSWWDVDINEFALGRFNEDNLHSADIYRRGGANNLEKACKIFEQIGGLDWDGSWFDTRYGDGKFYTCERDFVVNGVFSEIGWIEANTDEESGEQVMFGDYYVSGSRTDVDQGIFQIQLINNGHTFFGVYVAAEETVTWQQDRIDATSAYSDQCHIPDYSATVAGRWYYGKHPSDIMDICIEEDGTVEMSYSYNNGEDIGYGIGFTSDSGPHSIRVTWFEDKTEGISMYRIDDSGKLTEFFWEDVDISFDVDYAVCDDEEVNFQYWGRHSVNKLRLMSPTQDEFACARNRDLFDAEVFKLSSSSASSLFVSFFILFIFVLCF